jgi:hypothetical protein
VRTSIVAIAQPPWEMRTPATAQTVITSILAVVLAGFIVAALLHWRRSGKPDFLLMLLGGFVCSFNEESADVMGHCFFPKDGWIVHQFYGRGIPLWVVLAYVIFFGGLPYLMTSAFRRGVTHRTMWTAIGIFWVLNTVLEMPVLSTNLYLYYGDQPFEVGGFPLSWLVINSLGALFGAVVLTRLSWFFTGARQLLILLVPFATYMSSWVLAMPHFAITNTDASTGVRIVAAILSMALGLVAIDALIRFGTGEARLLPPPSAAVADRKDLGQAKLVAASSTTAQR